MLESSLCFLRLDKYAACFVYGSVMVIVSLLVFNLIAKTKRRHYLIYRLSERKHFQKLFVIAFKGILQMIACSLCSCLVLAIILIAVIYPARYSLGPTWLPVYVALIMLCWTSAEKISMPCALPVLALVSFLVYLTKRRKFFPDFEEFEDVVDDLREKANRSRQDFKSKRQIKKKQSQQEDHSAVDLNNDYNATELSNYHLLDS